MNNGTVDRPNERVPSSYALRGWFKSEEEIQKHIDTLRYNEKLVNGVYIEDPDLSCDTKDPSYPVD